MIPSSVRILVCMEPQDMRRSFDRLALVVREHLGEDPQSGALYVFVGKRATRAKVLWWERNGYCLLCNQLASHCTSFDCYHRFWLLGCLDCSCSVDEAIPAAALLDWRVRSWWLIEVGVGVVGMSGDDAVLTPSDEGLLVDPETGRCLCFRQHASFSEPVVARAQSVSVDEIRHPQGGEARIATSRSCRAPRTEAPRVEQVGDLRVDVVVEKFVDERDDSWWSLHLLGR